MNTKVEAKAKRVNIGYIAIESHQEAAGFAGMPLIDKQHYAPQKTTAFVAEPPDVVIGRRAVIVPEK
jgi:hypothetical protein